MIAAPLYNHAEYLPAALDSLLAQTDRDFSLLLVDDLSDDETSEIAQRYVDRDQRVTYHRNEARLGLAANWRRCFELARQLYPEAEYFAWGSDHDLWHPRWLETLVAAIEKHDDVVLAYPTCERITAAGELAHRRGGFETVEVSSPTARLRLGCRLMHAGDMVYGLVRADCLARAGIFRRVLEPDRLLMAELAVQGRCHHVPQPLWQRRFVKSAARARQRRAIFPGRRPLYSWLAPWLVRPAVFLWVYAIRAQGRPEISRRQGLVLGATYALASLDQVAHRRIARAAKRLSRARKKIARARKRVRRATFRVAGLAVRKLRRAQRRVPRAAVGRAAVGLAARLPGLRAVARSRAESRRAMEMAMTDTLPPPGGGGACEPSESTEATRPVM